MDKGIKKLQVYRGYTPANDYTASKDFGDFVVKVTADTKGGYYFNSEATNHVQLIEAWPVNLKRILSAETFIANVSKDKTAA